MSNIDVDVQAAQVGAASAPRVQTSRLAMFSMMSGMVCIPGLSGLLGLVFGLMALRQISRSQYITGENLAWMGVLSGLVNVVGWGALGAHLLNIRRQVDEPTVAFMQAWTKAEADGESIAAPGLSPVMHKGEGELLRKALVERLGPYQKTGARTDFGYKLKKEGLLPREVFTASYDLEFQSGAPVSGDFEYVIDRDQLKVLGYHLNSPVLRDLEKQGMAEAHGEATPSLGDFSGGGPHVDPKQMRGFSKH